MNPNGSRVPHLREQLREARIQRAIRKTELQENAMRRQLVQESFSTGWPYQGWFPLDYPQLAFDPLSAPGPWVPVGGYRQARKDGSSWPVLRTETDLDRQREMARWLVDTNAFALGAMRRLCNFAIRTGYKYQVQAEETLGDSDKETATALADVVQDFIDDFMDRNHWVTREKEVFTRSRRDGECFVRTFVDDGLMTVRFVEPELIRRPLGDDEDYSWGIQTAPGDVEQILSYCYYPDIRMQEEYEPVPADEMFFLKLNTDSTVKRGISDFFTTRDSFDLSQKLIRNLMCGAGNQSAISWIEEYKLTSGAQMQGSLSSTNDRLQPSALHPVTGKPYNFQMFEPGLIIKTGAGKEYKPPPPANNAAPHTVIVQAGLRSIAQVWDMPEYMISADASNANFSSTLVAGAPFVISMETEQDRYRCFFLDILWRAVKEACVVGLIVADGRTFSYREIKRLVDIHATPPQISIVDKLQNAEINKIRLDSGVMSRQTWRAEDGLDDDRERQNLREEPVVPLGGGGQGGLDPARQTGFFPRFAMQDAATATQESLRARVVKLLESAERGNVPISAGSVVHSRPYGPEPAVERTIAGRMSAE